MKELEKYPKVKEAFEKYFFDEIYAQGFEALGHHLGIDVFYNLPPAMQWGVWVDFCDSKGVVIGINSTFGYAGRQIFRVYVGVDRHSSRLPNPSSRTEARQESFKQSLTILNSKI